MIKKPEDQENDVSHVASCDDAGCSCHDVAIPSKTWVDRFIRQHKDKIKKRKGKVMVNSRIVGATPEMINYYFDRMKNLFIANEYWTQMVVNFDETSISYGQRAKQVIVTRERQFGVLPTHESSYRFTFGAAISADGSRLPPLIVLPGATVPELPEEFCLRLGGMTARKMGLWTRKFSRSIAKRLLLFPISKNKEMNWTNQTREACLSLINTPRANIYRSCKCLLMQTSIFCFSLQTPLTSLSHWMLC